ncbi:MAG: glycosyltransferase [Reichenbachiella sp.]|uniref:glycosyltransferase n=1 Tax=Reichenbachiella sp. TaxID=2184521 RepID=UPI0032630E2B
MDLQDVNEPSIKNKVINGLWIGNELSNLELLTIHSFINNGHEFHLWVYEELENQLPDGALLKNANDIIPKNDIFRYQNPTTCGLGKGSVAGFSDIFRYKLLYDIGGWWVDMDVTCIKPFNIDQPYMFPTDHSFMVTGKILKALKKSQLMLDCYTESIQVIDENNDDWGRPISILIENVKKLNLEKYALNGFINHDSFVYVDLYRNYNLNLPANIHSFHWCHELWRSYNIDKSKFKKESTYGQLLITNNVISLDSENNWNVNHNLLKNFQLLMFRFFFTYPNIWQYLKSIKNKISYRYNLWIP